jgi:hypothetical protein
VTIPERRALSALLAVIGVVALFPLLQVGFVTNDDLKLSAAVMDRGLVGAAAVLWGFTRRDGRLDIAQMASWYLPFAFDSFVYFKAVSLAAIVADLLLFAAFARSVLGGSRAFYMALLLALVGLQNSWEHSALVAFPGLFTFTFAYLLGSFLAFQGYLRQGRVRWAVLSAALYLLTICSYEMYVLYVPVFFGLAWLAGRSPTHALRCMLLHLAGLAAYLVAWGMSHAFRLVDYPGVTIARGLELRRVGEVVWQFSISSLPSYFFFSPKYEFLLKTYRRVAGFEGLMASLDAGALVKALLVSGLFAYLMRPASDFETRSRSRLAALLGAGAAYFFVPLLLPALTERYQQEVRQQQLGMQCTYFSLFAWVWFAVVLLLHVSGPGASPLLRRIVTGVGAVVLAFVSLAVDYTNGAVSEWQGRGRERFETIDAFLESPGFAAIDEGSLIYAPTLWRSIATINFMGSAIDPRPSPNPVYENFWTFYFSKRSGKRVTVAERPERIPPSMRGFFYLRHGRPGAGRGQYLVFAWVERGKESPDRFMSDLAMVYDHSAWTAKVVGGSVAETGGEKVAVGLVGNGSEKTGEDFLFDVGTHYLDLGHFQRSAVQAEGPFIDVDTVFLAPSMRVESRVLKRNGWEADGWIQAEARAILQAQEPSRLVLEGYAPDYIFKTAGIRTLTLTAEVDGTAVGSRVLTAGGRFILEGNVPHGSSELVLRCGPVHNPQTIGVSPTDDREICLVIARAALRKREAGE